MNNPHKRLLENYDFVLEFCAVNNAQITPGLHAYFKKFVEYALRRSHMLVDVEALAHELKLSFTTVANALRKLRTSGLLDRQEEYISTKGYYWMISDKYLKFLREQVRETENV